MKKQNKTYSALPKTKALDKIVLFKDAHNDSRCRMIAYYGNKPFYDWPIKIKDAFNVDSLKFSLRVMLSTYSEYNLNQRKICKRIAKFYVAIAGERVITYQRGGVLFPSTTGV
jgi:hypothetical protein